MLGHSAGTRSDSRKSMNGPMVCPSYKMTVLGSAGVGKTTLIKRLMGEPCCGNYVPTIEDFHRHRFELNNGDQIELEIADESGLYAFPAMQRLAVTKSKVVLIVFDLTDKKSLKEAKNLSETYFKEGTEGADEMPPVIFVGNKNDLLEKKVDVSDIEDLVHGRPYIETTAKMDVECKSLLNLIYEALNIINPPADLKKRRSSSLTKLMQRMKGAS